MRFLIDTFSPEAAQKILDSYPAEGVTTNPAIICREIKELKPTLLALREVLGRRMLHVQTMQKTAPTMVSEALALKRLLSITDDGSDFYIKLPCVPEGIRACRLLKEQGVCVTMTAIFSPMQALISARYGADFVAPYVNKLDDVGEGEGCVEKIACLFERHDLNTKILAASFRNVEQVTRVALAGSQYCTLPPAFFEKLVYHPMTDLAIKGFEDDWQALYGGKKPADMI